MRALNAEAHGIHSSTRLRRSQAILSAYDAQDESRGSAQWHDTDGLADTLIGAGRPPWQSSWQIH